MVNQETAERLEEFARENPKAYAKILAKAKLEEWRRSKYQLHPRLPLIPDSENHQDYYVWATDPYGTEHLFFEESPDRVSRHYHRYGALTITRIAECTCPRCKKGKRLNGT